jgi:hypothetical protein
MTEITIFKIRWTMMAYNFPNFHKVWKKDPRNFHTKEGAEKAAQDTLRYLKEKYEKKGKLYAVPLFGA